MTLIASDKSNPEKIKTEFPTTYGDTLFELNESKLKLHNTGVIKNFIKNNFEETDDVKIIKKFTPITSSNSLFSKKKSTSYFLNIDIRNPDYPKTFLFDIFKFGLKVFKKFDVEFYNYEYMFSENSPHHYKISETDDFVTVEWTLLTCKYTDTLYNNYSESIKFEYIIKEKDFELQLNTFKNDIGAMIYNTKGEIKTHIKNRQNEITEAENWLEQLKYSEFYNHI